MATYTNFGVNKPSADKSTTSSIINMWTSDFKLTSSSSPHKTNSVYIKNLIVISVVFAFSVGLTIGILIPLVYFKATPKNATLTSTTNNPSAAAIRTIFLNNSYGHKNDSQLLNKFPTVSFIENFNTDKTFEDGLVDNGIYWSPKVEAALPDGYREKKHTIWSNYLEKAVAVKLENGCGRMQNRLVVFQDGSKGCVRYRQNTDQIQGELFSFYLAQILKLPNLAPSAISIVDLRAPLWRNLRGEIAAAQWNSKRPVVLTQFISNLNSANIPSVFKPLERHLNRLDVLNMTKNYQDQMRNLVELAQWSDLIVFDYLTANLDRIVNNLYNYQWNADIMNAPAHNLAKKMDSELLVFLDNESGLLHGYRLLKKYEVYHSILLENLCMFRKSTADVIKRLKMRGNVGNILRQMFEQQNSATVKDILPTIPDKSVKILNERIDKVYNQIIKCESMYKHS